MTGTAKLAHRADGPVRRIALVAAATLGLLACSERPMTPAAPAVTPPPMQSGDPEDADTYEIGFESGREQGYADGLEEGRDEGYGKGLEEGRGEGRSEALECVRQHATTSAAEAADLCE